MADSHTHNIQAVILAGGLGTRLRPLTYDIPKPMVPVADIPFLEHQIRLLKSKGVGEILLLTGYLGHMIREHFGDGQAFGIPISYVEEKEALGTGGALVAARQALKPTFLLLYGDSYLDIDYRALHQLLSRGKFKAILVAYDNIENTDVQNNLALNDTGAVLAYKKDSGDASLSHVEAGVTAFKKEALDSLPTDAVFNLEQKLFPKLIESADLGSFETTQRFYDIGTPTRLEALRRILT